MKLKRIVLFIIVGLFFSGCQRACSDLSRSVRTSKQDYRIELYSGGEKVKEFNLDNAIVNSSEGSDGYYFYHKDTLVEVSGDVIIYEKP